MADLRNDTDAVLDDTLGRLFLQHGAASNVGDRQACMDIHRAVAEILDEQARRTDVWILQRQS